MSTATTMPFEGTIRTTNAWLKELAEDLGWGDDRHRAYHALRAVLHALRDRLRAEEAADLAAQLPMLVRGFYFEGWRPGGKPLKERKREQFLAHVQSEFRNQPEVDVAEVAGAVFRLLSRHVSAGEIGDVRATLPEDIRSLWR